MIASRERETTASQSWQLCLRDSKSTQRPMCTEQFPTPLCLISLKVSFKKSRTSWEAQTLRSPITSKVQSLTWQRVNELTSCQDKVAKPASLMRSIQQPPLISQTLFHSTHMGGAATSREMRLSLGNSCISTASSVSVES